MFKEYKAKNMNISLFITLFFIIIYYITWNLRLGDELPRFFTRIGMINSSKSFLEKILQTRSNKNYKNFINNGNIKFNNITFKYPKADTYIFKNFNFEIKPHDKIAIVGRSGSGKTTLMRLLVGINSIQEGNILIDNVNINEANIEYLRDNIVYVNQRTQLFNDTVVNNIKYGNNISTMRINSVLKKYDLNSIYSELKNGINSSAGVFGNNLSLGMQKVTMILRSVLKNSKIIVFDEPLAGLDKNTRIKILNLIKNECKNKTIIIITHDKEVFDIVDKKINLNELNKKQQEVIYS